MSKDFLLKQVEEIIKFCERYPVSYRNEAASIWIKLFAKLYRERWDLDHPEDKDD